MHFTARLQQLPSASHIAVLHLLDVQGQLLARIENRPGQAGSLAVYAALASLYGNCITPAAAGLGLEWYGEHQADALAHPGKHPNIDRLRDWAAGTDRYWVQVIAA